MVFLQGRAANTEDTTVYKTDSKERGKQSLGRNRSLGQKEENNPWAGADPWDVVPARRNLILAGTPIHAPKEDAGQPAPTAGPGDRNGNHGFNSLATSQGRACGHPASPAGKGGNMKAEIPATQGSWRICSWRKSVALTLPQGLPWGTAKGAELAAPPCTGAGKAIEKLSLEHDSQESTAPGQSCPTAVPMPGSHSVSKEQRPQKGLFKPNLPAQCVGTVDKSWL